MTRPDRPSSAVLVVLLALSLAACAGDGSPSVEPGGAALGAVEGGASDEPEPDEPSPSATPSATATPSTAPDVVASPTAPTFDEVCAGRDEEAFIEVLSPQPDATVTVPVTVTGCGNTFEANYQYRVTAADGSVLVEDFGTMSCGNGCVGDFSFDVAVDATGAVVVTVFETDAQDGSPRHVVEVPLTIG